MKIVILACLFLANTLAFATTAPADDWIDTMSSQILSCKLDKPCPANSICQIEVYANTSDWFKTEDAQKNELTISGFFVWQQGSANDQKQDVDKIMFPARIHKKDNSFMITSMAGWAFSGALTINHIRVGETQKGVYNRPVDGDQYAYECFRYKNPK